jgi:folate-binding protein YgfZ
LDRLAYLEHAGALVAAGVVQSFGHAEDEYAALTTGTALLDASNEARLDVAGVDAPTFLHRLLTANVRHLAPGHGTPAFLLSSTGRIRLALTVLRENEARYTLFAGGVDTADLLAELDRYLFTERVELAPIEALHAQLSLQGPTAAATLAAAGLPRPEAPFAHAEGHLAGLPVRVVRHDRFATEGFDVLVPAQDFEAAFGALVGAGAHPVGHVAAEMHRVETGRPAFGAEWTPEASPLEVSGLYGVTEGKGCYPGQEVVERTLSMGSPPRALIRLQAEAALTPGTEVSAAGGAIGQVTSAATLPDARHLALALVKRRFGETDEPLRVGGIAARRLP